MLILHYKKRFSYFVIMIYTCMQNILFLIVFFIIYEQFRYQIYLYIYRLEPSFPANVRSEASWFLEQAWLKNDQRQAVGYAVVPRLKKNTGRLLRSFLSRDVWGRGLGGFLSRDVFVSRCFLLVGNGTWEVTDSANQSV